MKGVVADEKLRLLAMWFSGLYFDMYPLMMTVLAVPCSPISRTAWRWKENSNDFRDMRIKGSEKGSDLKTVSNNEEIDQSLQHGVSITKIKLVLPTILIL